MKKNYNVLNDCVGMDDDEIIDIVLATRGIKDKEHFLNPVPEDELPYEDMPYMQDAGEILMQYMKESDPKVGVYYDVDTDGITSGTIFVRWFKQTYGIEPAIFINDGKAHGVYADKIIDYTNNIGAIELLVVVDSLNSSIDDYRVLNEMFGIDIIILDHHAIKEDVEYDRYVTLVSSQREEYKNKALSGAGVTWKFCSYMDKLYDNDYAENLVDLAACGILADVSDVSEESYENRYIVNKGLRNLKNPAIKKIVGGYDFNSKSVLFSVAPLVNASCRCGDNMVAVKMFLTDDNKELLKLKKQLEGYKEKQNEEVDYLMPDIMKQIDEQKDESVVAIRVQTDYGIAGLIGNKILDIVGRPLFIISWQRNGKVGGSMRSVGYGDFRKMCNDIGIAELNGHEEASGFECNDSRFYEFLHIIREKVSTIKKIEEVKVDIDAEIDITDATKRLIGMVRDVNFISGNGFQPIQFKISNVDDYTIGSFRQGKHLTMTYMDCFMFIEWNTKCDFDDMEEHSVMNDVLTAYGELEAGMLGRKYLLKMIMSDYEFE